ncbi:hypothetical protein [Kineobactrum salinum]|uniref:hypothetical protein n=1 Tax=Kineobactrum salinum TaxID=2708301 RepID=UPI0018D84B18|nr:hypothetical protein [Kineobactrum salinum]
MKAVNSLSISLLTSVILAEVSLSSPATAQTHPPAVQNVVDRGVTIQGTFDASGNLTG